MSKVYMISDLHFGHKNIALHRGFSSSEEHDEYIVKKWNEKVTKKDVVWVLGDITMEKANYDILDRLKGIKKVVLGNHDKPQHVFELLKHVNKVCGCTKYKGCWLTHIPMHSQELIGNEINVHGHIHEKSIDDARYVNVCVDVTDSTPILFDSILNYKNRIFTK